jgi:cbb3-type cytochrome oxidase subunit 3
MVQGAIAAAVVVAVALVLTSLWWLARRTRRRGTAGQALAGAMAAYDEAMHTTAHEAYVEVRAQDERGANASSPADR